MVLKISPDGRALWPCFQAFRARPHKVGILLGMLPKHFALPQKLYSNFDTEFNVDYEFATKKGLRSLMVLPNYWYLKLRIQKCPNRQYHTLKQQDLRWCRFLPDSSCMLAPFITASVCWQIEFLYNRFSKLFIQNTQSWIILSSRVVMTNPFIED